MEREHGTAEMKAIIRSGLFFSCTGSVYVVADVSPPPFSVLLLPPSNVVCLGFSMSRISFLLVLALVSFLILAIIFSFFSFSKTRYSETHITCQEYRQVMWESLGVWGLPGATDHHNFPGQTMLLNLLKCLTEGTRALRGGFHCNSNSQSTAFSQGARLWQYGEDAERR